MLADCSTGMLAVVSPPVADAMIEAERLSATHSETLGTPSLDILHVACALVLGVEEFLTFDQRQLNLAKAAGLKTPKL
jgi:predicted nucleic acid-binding protein